MSSFILNKNTNWLKQYLAKIKSRTLGMFFNLSKYLDDTLKKATDNNLVHQICGWLGMKDMLYPSVLDISISTYKQPCGPYQVNVLFADINFRIYRHSVMEITVNDHSEPMYISTGGKSLSFSGIPMDKYYKYPINEKLVGIFKAHTIIGMIANVLLNQIPNDGKYMIGLPCITDGNTDKGLSIAVFYNLQIAGHIDLEFFIID